VFGDTRGAPVCRRTATLLVYEAVLPAVPICVGRVRRGLDDALLAVDVGPERRADIALAVTEAATNVVLHAYGCLASGPLCVAAALSDASVAVTVSDCGGGMRDVGNEPGLGAGISIMGQVADALRIAPEPVGPGTRVWMLFRHVTLDPDPLGELLHDGVPAQCDADVLQEYVEALQAGGAPLDDAFAMLDEARRALEHAKRLRRRGWVQ
jgi:serine/threonine-protein kinase RsbW